MKFSPPEQLLLLLPLPPPTVEFCFFFFFIFFFTVEVMCLLRKKKKQDFFFLFFLQSCYKGNSLHDCKLKNTQECTAQMLTSKPILMIKTHVQGKQVYVGLHHLVQILYCNQTLCVCTCSQDLKLAVKQALELLAPSSLRSSAAQNFTACSLYWEKKASNSGEVKNRMGCTRFLAMARGFLGAGGHAFNSGILCFFVAVLPPVVSSLKRLLPDCWWSPPTTNPAGSLSSPASAAELPLTCSLVVQSSDVGLLFPEDMRIGVHMQSNGKHCTQFSILDNVLRLDRATTRTTSVVRLVVVVVELLLLPPPLLPAFISCLCDVVCREGPQQPAMVPGAIAAAALHWSCPA